MNNIAETVPVFNQPFYVIIQRMNFSKPVTFWTTFPRKHLGGEDFTKTLSELGLAPSAALIVDPVSFNTHVRCE